MSRRSGLYVGQVFHRRTRPRGHVLHYRVFSLLLDLDEIDDIARRVGPFSRNRFNLFAFHDADFGRDADEPLARHVARELAAADIDGTPARILLSCYPRVLGYAFNPLSLFYCLDAEDRVFAVVHEVHNTFGERHAYALAVDPPRRPVPDGAADGAGRWIRQRADKALFVSPFNHMDMRYEFRLDVPGERQVIAIRVFDDAGHFLTASYTAARRPLDTRRLLGVLVALPFMTFKVVAGIHLEAALLWLKRVPWFAHVPRPAARPVAAPPPGDAANPIVPPFDARDHVGHR